MIQTKNNRSPEHEIADAVDYVLTGQRQILIIGEPGDGIWLIGKHFALLMLGGSVYLWYPLCGGWQSG